MSPASAAAQMRAKISPLTNPFTQDTFAHVDITNKASRLSWKTHVVGDDVVEVVVLVLVVVGVVVIVWDVGSAAALGTRCGGRS